MTMRVKIGVVEAAAEYAVSYVESRRAEMKEKYEKEKAEIEKSWWGWASDDHLDNEHEYFGYGALEKGQELLLALSVVANECTTVELTTKEAAFVARWLKRREEELGEDSY